MLSNRIDRWLRKFADDTLFAELDAAIGPDFSGDMTFEDDVHVKGDLRVDGSLTFTVGSLSLSDLSIDEISELTPTHGILFNNHIKLAANKNIYDSNGNKLTLKRKKITLSYSDFATDALTNDLEILELPPEAKVVDVYANLVTEFTSTSTTDQLANWDGAADGTIQLADATGLNVGDYVAIDDSDSSTAYGYVVSVSSNLGDGLATYDINVNFDCTGGGIVQLSLDPAAAGMNVGSLVEIDGNAPLDPIRGYVVSMSGQLGDGAATYDINFSQDGTSGGIIEVDSDPAAAGMSLSAMVEIDDSDSFPTRGYVSAISLNLGDGAATYDINFDIDGSSVGEIIVLSDPSTAGMNVNARVEIDGDSPLDPIRGYVDAINSIGAGASAYDENFIDVDGSASGICIVEDASAMTVGDYIELDNSPTLAILRGYITDITTLGAGAGLYDEAGVIDPTATGRIVIADSTDMVNGQYVEIDDSVETAVRGFIVAITDLGGASSSSSKTATGNGDASGYIDVPDITDLTVGQAVIIEDSTTDPVLGYVSGWLDLGTTFRIFIEDAPGGGGTPVDLSAYTTADTAVVKLAPYKELHIQDAPSAGADVDLSAFAYADSVHVYSIDASQLTIEDAVSGGSPIDISAYTVALGAHIYSIAAWNIMIVDSVGGAAVDLSTYTKLLNSHVYSIDSYQISIEDAISGGSPINLISYTVAQAARVYSIDCYELHIQDKPSGGSNVNLSSYSLALASHVYSIDAFEVHIQDAASGGSDVDLSMYSVAQGAHVFMGLSAVTISVGPTGVATGLMLANDVKTASGLLTAEAYKGADLTNPGRSNMYNASALTSIRAYIISTGLVLDQLTDGIINFYIEWVE